MTSSRLESLKKFLAEEPNEVFTRYAIALEYASLHNLSEAIAQLEEVIAFDSNYVPAYQRLGNYLQQIGRIDEAVTILKNGIKIAGAVGNTHAQNEMQDTLDELEDAGR